MGLIQDKARMENKQVLFVAVVGSHAYGLSNSTSDLDVKWIYVERDKRKYLSLKKSSDVLQQVCPPFEIEGWDIYKASHLYLKSNPGMFEWLTTENVLYDEGIGCFLRENMEKHFSLKALGYHYYQMLVKNVKKLEANEKLELKEIKICIQAIRCYVMLKNLLYHREIIKSLQVPTLLESIPLDGEALEQFKLTINSKTQNSDFEKVPIRSIHAFLKRELNGFEEGLKQLPIGENAASILDQEIWRILQV